MKTIKNAIRIGLTVACFSAILSTGDVSAQILRVDSVSVDSVWNSDSTWTDLNDIVQKRFSRDCRISFIPQGEGKARMSVAMSVDSGKTWDPLPDPLVILKDALSPTFITGKKVTFTVRVPGGDTPGVAFKMTAQQAAPLIKGNPKMNLVGGITVLTPGQNISVVFGVKLATDTLSTGNGFCSLQKVYWDAGGEGTIDDSSTGANVLAWTWPTKVPSGASGQTDTIIARAVDKNGLSSVPETLTVQFGLNRMIVMKDIPAGTFSMGEVNVASPVHQVTLSAFKMQETDVTQEQYLAVMNTNPSYFNTGDGIIMLRPVEMVDWYHAVQFCNALSKLSGLDTVYNTTTWGTDFTKNGYRLPTEAQWEYACRAGTTTAFYWGDDSAGSGGVSWNYYNAGSTTHPVATKLANPYGLYDITGNVWNWCSDKYDTYTADSVTDPPGPSTGTYRSLRGGSWNDNPGYYRSAYRNAASPEYKFYCNGLRVVLPK
jgi:formylglycine-generating enzyme required for sulfatase activity